MKRKNLKYLAILTILLLGVYVIYSSITQKDTVGKVDPSLSIALREEFEGSYLENSPESSRIVEVNLVASEGELEIFEGVKTKVWNYNSSVPGPEIRIQYGDTLKVNFQNNLPEETTIHWHGVRVPNAMDGVPGLNQDPIKPGDSFVYEFTPKDVGTFWFHPHVRTAEQIERGLFGTLIVEDEISSKFSQDITWVVDDWRLLDNYQIDPNFVTGGDLMHDGRWGNVITVNGSLEETLNARPGERIRLRIVNASNARVYSLAMDGLNANIIAVDGMYTKEGINPNGFEISPGNRVDLDIQISTDTKEKTYIIRDFFLQDPNVLGKISVSGESVTPPDFKISYNIEIPSWDEAVNAQIDKTYRFNSSRGGEFGIQWTINGKAFPDYDPFQLKFDEFNKIEFINESYRLHPMHLHGQFFKVISKNGVVVDEPFFRDTVLLKGQESIEIGLVPLDKGKWVQHCHILEHAEAGMITVVEVK